MSADFIAGDRDDDLDLVERQPHPFHAVHHELLMRDRGSFDNLCSNTTLSDDPVDVHSDVADLAYRQPTVQDMGLWHVTVKVCRTFYNEPCF